MNVYKKAIEKKEVIEYFRGQREYFDLDRDRGIHDNAYTSMHVIGYGTEFGSEVLYTQLESDLNIFMNRNDFDFDDFKIILGFFWSYIIYRKEEGLLSKDWNISPDLISRFRDYYTKYEEIGKDLNNVNRVLTNMKERYDFDLLNLDIS